MFNFISPLFIGWCGPLFVMIPFASLCRKWLGKPTLFVATVYTLAIISGIIADLAANIGHCESTIVAALYALLLICLILSLVLLFYRTILHKGLYKSALDRLNTIE